MTERQVAVVGVGHSPVYRRDDVSLGSLAVDAAQRAIADANLTPADIDGVVAVPEQPFEGAGNIEGINFVGPPFLMRAMGLDASWGQEIEGNVGRAFVEGVNAVGSGACDYVLVLRAMHNPSGRYGHTNPTEARGAGQFTGPYGLSYVAVYASVWQRYMHLYGTTREDYADFIVNNRRNALLWEHGYWYQHRPEELTREDYLSARMVAWPLSILDCDIPVQGCGAFVLTTAERARDLCEQPAYVLGTVAPPREMGGGPMTLERWMAAGKLAGRHLWERSGVGPGDVDVVNVYDGFSFFPPTWLEALGFCEEGEGFAFMTPERVGIGGELPVNTSSGNQGAGRMHGVPHIMDGALQVMGRSGPRQVAGAEISVAVVGPTNSPGGVVFSSSPR